MSHAIHGFLSRDGLPPRKLLRIGREQLQPYGVEIMDREISDAVQRTDGFELTTAQSEIFRSRKLLLVAGIPDNLPELEGFSELLWRERVSLPLL